MQTKKLFLPMILVLAVMIGSIGTLVVIDVFAGDEPVEENQMSDEEIMEAVMEQMGGQEEIHLGDLEEEMEKIAQAYHTLMERYVDEPDAEKLIEGAIIGMLESLEDPYSEYMDADTASQFMESLDSSFEGIGAEVSMINGRVTIVAPFRDSPAERAGLRPNDQVMEIDGEDIEGLTLTEAVMKIRGEQGTTVTLTIDRPGVSDPLEIDVVRDEIPIETVHSEIIEESGQRIGYLELTSFSENTAERFEEELTALEEDGIDGLIIDVRGNPGGYLQSVEDIGNLIIPGGSPILQIEDRDGERMRTISSLDEDIDYPIVSIIDEGSASASEILSAALKEAGGHDVVGQSSFGKGTVQQTIPMGDGSQLKLTLFRWLTSDGNNINEVGVEPTVEVAQPDFFYVSPISADEPLVFDMNSEHVESAQVMLAATGYDPGREDGYFDEGTVEAVEAFQEAEGLDVTGEIGEETADRLQEVLIEQIQDRENDLQLKRALELVTG
ncbi:S41 family peptidase [Salisediminibacterium selenitireducens]|uniref:Carboxyl-terminal protease n=1 Tax=Bacillus selenitireducens (strain ATCC 700615 / DSM 15326 / MLS10) TaxID=439292 RepID=D6Y0Z7_BACIE|nr:S41 family peptidase [Salisediminibacterium selenitireducens]ADH98601.1 carboxyl-terminal protease [[Bacillus] selenitireducens MLS10]